ncbi:MAG: DUF4139 domain-containing protein [Rhodospirillaceae bacterium]|nr:DUF4139 domain-containing protein [Rhodospirillaceae bacterium]
MRSKLFAGTALAIALSAQSALLAPTARAETTVTTDSQTGIAVTIYNDNLALIRDSRTVAVSVGENDIAFIDVSAAIRPETALLGSAGGTLDVLEQNFDFDLLTPEKLLEKSVGSTIRVIRTNPETGEDSSEEAEVLSVAGGQAVLRIGDRIETAIPGRFVYSGVPDNLRARPTLVVKAASDTGGNVAVDLSYLTGGLSWSADYVVDLADDEKTLALNGWVTLTNQSGIAYKDAKLQLVAGDVNQVRQQFARDMMAGAAMAEAMPAPKMAEESAFEYHLYSLARPTTLKENQTKQVAMLAAVDVPVEKQYLLANSANVWGNYGYNFGETPRQNATVKLKLRNEEAANLGMPLPAGIIRVYKKDSDGDVIFVGEDRIDHTPKNERIDLTLGQAFDITARAKQRDHARLADNLYENAYEIEIKNAKAEAVTVDLREALPGQWQILEESQPHEKLDANTAAWKVEVPAEGSTTLTYKVRIRF